MNRYASTILAEFNSQENREHLYESIMSYFNNDATVKRLLGQSFEDFMFNYSDTIRSELSLSDPLPGTTILDQVNCFNNQFLDDRIEFIKTHVGEETAAMYMVGDGMATTRHGAKHYQAKADNILDSWRGNSGRGVQSREDPGADVYPNNPYAGDGLKTGVMFCDQSSLGMQRHQDMFFSGIHALNKTDRPHENTPFGVSTPEADARLLSRSIFRKNEAGVENGIARYESRLYNRHLERDIDEGLRGRERDCMVMAHDMTSLYRRVDHKNAARDKYGGRRMETKLQNNNAQVSDNMRYC